MMGSGSFSEELKEAAAGIWNRIYGQPFLLEMREGTLPLDKFRFYIGQDYVYLVDFARGLGLAAAKAEDMETMGALAELLKSSITVEIEMLEELSRRLGMASGDLRKTLPAPTNVAYTRHLLHVAYSGSVGEIMASMLPCMWSYQEIGEWMRGSPGLDSSPLYREWADTYVSQEYIDLVRWYRDLTDRSASAGGSRERELMLRHFVLSSRYEYLFWEMAYKKEEWPV